MTDLHSAGHRRGVAAAPHALVAEAGRAILAEGGNALEAMVAMAASIAAVYPHMNHIGGDGFWMVREPKGRVLAIMAAGFAGANARRRYRNHETIPARGPLAALTFRAPIGGWARAGACQGARWEAARRAAPHGYPSGARRICGEARPDGAHGQKLPGEGRAGICATFLVDGQAARSR